MAAWALALLVAPTATMLTIVHAIFSIAVSCGTAEIAQLLVASVSEGLDRCACASNLIFTLPEQSNFPTLSAILGSELSRSMLK